MKLKKLLVGVIVFSSILIGLQAHASTLTDLKAEIASLKQELVDIRTSLTGAAAGTPVNGGWSAWANYYGCYNGKQTQTRTCTNPKPANGGASCINSAGKVAVANYEARVINCTVSNLKSTTLSSVNNGTWSTWTPSASTCNGYTKTITQTRTCVGASNGGACLADADGTLTSRTITCSSGGLYNNGNWSEWTPVLTCGTGNVIQTRTCVGASNGGTCIADADGMLTTRTVSKTSCALTPVNGGWSAWTNYYGCSNGKQAQTRSCNNPAPANGGKACVGSYYQSVACAPMPDIIVTDFIIPSYSITTQSSFNLFKMTIKNVGNDTAKGNFANHFEIANDSNGNGSIVKIIAYDTNHSAIYAGQSDSDIEGHYEFKTAGNYSVRACADQSYVSSPSDVNGGSIAESNENNNCSSWVNISVKDSTLKSGTLSEANPQLKVFVEAINTETDPAYLIVVTNRTDYKNNPDYENNPPALNDGTICYSKNELELTNYSNYKTSSGNVKCINNLSSYADVNYDMGDIANVFRVFIPGLDRDTRYYFKGIINTGSVGVMSVSPVVSYMTYPGVPDLTATIGDNPEITDGNPGNYPNVTGIIKNSGNGSIDLSNFNGFNYAFGYFVLVNSANQTVGVSLFQPAFAENYKIPSKKLNPGESLNVMLGSGGEYWMRDTIGLNTGIYRIKLCADLDNKISEINEANNCSELKELKYVKRLPINGGWSAWTPIDGLHCGLGQTYTQTRNCNNPAPENGGANCVGDSTRKTACLGSINGGWSAWTPATSTCGTGTFTQTRTCTNPSPAYGGANCSGPTTQQVNKTACAPTPINGGWSAWTNYYGCSNGKQAQTRSCNNPAPANGGAVCAGDYYQTIPCAVNGGWSAWTNMGSCSSHKQVQLRSCNNPAPANGGAACVGVSSQVIAC